MRSVIVFSNDEKLELLRKGLRSRKGPQNLIRSLQELTDLLASGQQFRNEEVIVFVDSYLERQYPVHGGPVELTPDDPGMRAMALIRQRRPAWVILGMLHAKAQNDGFLSMATEKIGDVQVGIRAHNTHSMDVPKWHSKVFQNAINLAFQHHSMTKKSIRREAVLA